MAKRADTGGSTNLNNFDPRTFVEGNDPNLNTNGEPINEGNVGTGKVLGCVDPRALNYNSKANSNDGSCRYRTETRDNSIDQDVFIRFNTNIKGASVFQNGVKVNNITTNDSLQYTTKELQTPRVFTVRKTGTESTDEYKVQAIKRDLIKTFNRNIDVDGIQSTLRGELVDGIVGQQEVRVSFLYFDVIVYKKIDGVFQEQRTVSPRRNDEIEEKPDDVVLTLSFNLEKTQPPEPPPTITIQFRNEIDLPGILRYKLPNKSSQELSNGENEEIYELSDTVGNVLTFRSVEDIPNNYSLKYIITERSGKRQEFDNPNFTYELKNTDIRVETTLKKQQPPTTQPPPKRCEDRNALNFNKVGACKYPPTTFPPPTVDVEFRGDVSQQVAGAFGYRYRNESLNPLGAGVERRNLTLDTQNANYLYFETIDNSRLQDYNVLFTATLNGKEISRQTELPFQLQIQPGDLRIFYRFTKNQVPEPPKPKRCEDRNAINFGKVGACKYPPTTLPPTTISIQLNADVADERLLEYRLSDGQNGFIQNGNNTLSYTLTEDRGNTLTIRPIGSTASFNANYNITGGTVSSTDEFTTQVELGANDIRGEIKLSKSPPPTTQPPPKKCEDRNAINFGKVGACRYPPDPPQPVVINVRVEGDVVGNDLIGYRLSDGTENRVRDGISTTRYTYNDGGPNKIEFFRAGNIDYSTHSIRYFISNGNRTRELNEFDFTEEIGGNDITIRVVLTKDAPNPPRKQPRLSLSETNGTYDLASKQTFTIPFSTTNADFVRFSIGNVVRDTRSNSIVLSPSDFNRGVGQYTVNIQPVSNVNGSGQSQKFVINVFQTGFIPGPDIRTIDFPELIEGEDFVGFNVNFDISYQSINTNYVEVYVSKVDRNYLLRSNAPGSGKLTFNVGDVLRRSKLGYNQNTDKIDFDLILVPYNTQADELASGRQERINIRFDQGLRIRREDFVRDIRTAFQREFDTSRIDEDVTRFLSHQMHLGNGDNKLIANWAIDRQSFDDSSVILKLYEPLPNEVGVDDKVWISKIQSIPIVDEVRIVDEEVQVCTPLQPNFNIDISDPIGYEIIDSLTASGSLTSTELIDTYVSSSEFTLTELDLQFVTGSDDTVDYYWSDFVKYSSAKERVENFWYKVRLIESYKSTSGSLVSNDSSGSIEVLNELKRTEQKIKKLEGGFDAFERYLYNTTGSLSYPKTGGLLVSSSTTDAESWYVTASLSAIEYDRNNIDALSKNLPKHVQNADNGQEFVLFFDMVGQHFDILWNYVRSVDKAKKLEHKVDNGIANELIYHMLESLGWDADMGTASQTLWEYAFGQSKTGEDVFETSGQQRQYQIWRRLLNNLPYLLKHKGTKRALHAAMSCYGIPTSMLSIMEFGGPNEPTSGKTKQVTFDDRTSAINFNFSSSVDIPWKLYNHTLTNDYPNAIETRVLTTTRQDQTIISNEDNWALKVTHDTGSFAKLQFEISSSNSLHVVSSSTSFPFYNDEYTQFVINRSYSGSSEIYDIIAKEGFQGRIRNEESASIVLPSGSTTWGSGSEIVVGLGFTGSIDDIRLWREPLNEISINNHTLSPDSIDGNSYSSSTEDLLFRNDFEYPKNRGSSGDVYIKNVAITQDYATFSTASNFDDIIEYPYQYTTYDRQVVANVPSIGLTFGDKFRFEEQELIADLNYRSRATKKSFDQAAIDSNQLGLFFSPIKEINMDILKSLGKFNADDFIGNPSDLYEDEYGELKELRTYYFDRFNLNLNEYIQLVRYIDKTIFTTLESLSPARAKVSKGLLIEPHFLERNKTKWEKPTAQIDGINANHTVSIPVTSSYINEETTIDVNTLSFDFDYDDLNTTIDSSQNIILTSSFFDYQSTIDTQPEIILSSSLLDYDGIVNVEQDVNLTVERNNYTGIIETEPEIVITSEKKDYITSITVTTDGDISSDILINSGSDMGGISISIDAQILGTIQGEFENDVLLQVGTNPDSQFVKGFGLYGENGNSIRTFYDKFNNVVKERVKVFKVVEEKSKRVPVNINRFDGSSYFYDGSSLTENVSTTERVTKVTILPFTGSDGNETNPPEVGGKILEVTPLNGYFPSHFRYVGDRTTGLDNSYSRGSKQTSSTTIDGSSAVETFITNPNTLRVTDTGRGSGEPILEVD